MVAVSALAIRAAIPDAAFAQLVLTCPVGIRFSEIVECTNIISRLTLRPNGVVNVNTGCLLTSLGPPILAGQCVLSTSGPGPSKNVVVTIPDNKVTIPGPGDNLIIRRWRIARTTTNGQNQTLTFTPAEVLNTVTFNVGARLESSGNQVMGSYVGTNIVRAQLAP